MNYGHAWLALWVQRSGVLTARQGPMWFRRWCRAGDSNDARFGSAGFRRWVVLNTSVS